MFLLSARISRAAQRLLAACVVLCSLQIQTATAQTNPKPHDSAKQSKAAALTQKAPTAHASGPGWRIAPLPAWVIDPPFAQDIESITLAPPVARGAPSALGGFGATPQQAATNETTARRELLVDLQQYVGISKPQAFLRVRQVATDTSTVGAVSQPQIEFNPSFQNVMIHNASVWRDGKKLDRLSSARIELMRREKQLEQQTITGTQTLLVVLSDVRVGEPVELAYTIEGQNPIFEGHVSAWMSLASDVPINVLHNRIIAPADRNLQVKHVGTEQQVQRSVQGGLQILSLSLRDVAPVVIEQNTPLWHRNYPWVNITDYANWAEVDAWAQRLFAQPTTTPPAIAEQIAQFRAKNLQGEALVMEVLRFVQDEVRYFSVSLGQSSHKPKPPERTLAERLGDCKDKTLLLNTLLTELGFKAQPALVSLFRHRGVDRYLPSHDMFDHVISRVEIDGRAYFFDSTAQNQGLSLKERGYYDYGRALVVGSGQALQTPDVPDFAINQLGFEQIWDVSDLAKPIKFTAVLYATGLEAERWRAGRAMAGDQRLMEGLSSLHLRMFPGLVKDGQVEVKDDRQTNRFEMRQVSTQADLGKYSTGTIELEYSAAELWDALVGPSGSDRRSPFALTQPLYVDSRVTFIAPRPWNLKNVPAPIELADKHLRFTAKAEVDGAKFAINRRIERRTDHVMPADLQTYRETTNRMRTMTSGKMRVALLDSSAYPQAEVDAITKRVMKDARWRADTLGGILMQNESTKYVDSKSLSQIPTSTPLAAKINVSRAISLNLLGEFDAALRDADAALGIDPKSEEAMDARGVSLSGLGRAEEALREFQKIQDGTRKAAAQNWIGALQHLLGRSSEAESALRYVIDRGQGEEREFAMIWLFLAAEKQGVGKGKAAIAPHLANVDAKKLTGAILRYFDGQLDRDALIKQAREKPDMERLNLAEAYFFIAQNTLLSGQADEGVRWLNRTLETGATPYREVTFAKLELQRLQKR